MSDDATLIKNLISSGAVTEAQVNECQEIQQRLMAEGKSAPLEAILMKKGYATPEQVQLSRMQSSARMQECPNCKARYNVASLESGKKVRCRKCNEIFLVTEGSGVSSKTPSEAIPVASAEKIAGTFEVTVGDQKGLIFKMHDNASVNIGRAPTNELRLTGVSISRVHAKFESQNGVVTLTDLNSSNGSFVNDDRIAGKELTDGDRVRLGDVEFLFRSANAPAASATPAKTSSAAIRCNKCSQIIPPGNEKYVNDAPICRKCLTTSADPLVGMVISGCKILKKLGEGGMGAVYKAHQISMDRFIALKALPASKVQDEETLKRFLREAKSGAQLVHQNIIQLYDMGQTPDGIYYILMEYVDGGDLMGRIEKLGRIPWREAVEIAAQVADALTVAYTKRIVHRDIKPDNILFNEENVVKLADMGLAKRLDDREKLTRTGMAVGTPYYMPPEQFKSNDTVDHRSDIYALGITLYHMITGDLPFKGKNLIEVAKKIINEPIKPPKDIIPELPEQINQVILKMTAKDPAKRFQKPDELLAALTELKN